MSHLGGTVPVALAKVYEGPLPCPCLQKHRQRRHGAESPGELSRQQEWRPCIDTGTAFLEVDGKVVFDLPPGSYKGSAPDMGAYERDYNSTSAAEAARPGAMRILSIHPNPFNPSTSITVNIPKAGRVTLSVYNAAGQKVADLLSGFCEAGGRTVTWNGSGHASGLYVCRLEAGGMVSFEKMLLLK